LLQHAGNPVDWFPWGEEAFAKARGEDKPIFLSVGYAACHWCHVMERESFEDETTAALLNERFVSIKVDREERPDIDGIYMTAVQAMNDGHGGWPMSVFLTPDGTPFFAGTYFPNEPRGGMPSFVQVLEGVAAAWRDRRIDVVSQGDRVRDALARTVQHVDAGPARSIDEETIAEALASITRSFDPLHGGTSGAPKFPQPMVLEFLLRMALRGSERAADMVVLTLERMADGGIRDQISGGFSRYAVDEAWQVPHFEKMLYDNAQLALVYLHGWQVTSIDRFRDISVSILEELRTEMAQPQGGFFSSQDADSEGVEGRYFTWRWDDLASAVGEPVATALGASPTGNWHGPPGTEGTNVLWQPTPVHTVAARYGMDPGELARDIESAKRKLALLRRSRVRPAIDDKIIAAWNALAIRAFAEAGRVFHDASYLDAARRSAEFLRTHLRRSDGRLLRSWRDGRVSTGAFADDHALVVSAFLTLYEATGDGGWFGAAREVADDLLRLFHDEGGGFFQTGIDADRLITRPRDLQDNAVPSGNSASAEALLRLAMFTGEASYESAAIGALALIADVAAQAPTAFGHALCAMESAVGPRKEVAIVGDPTDRRTAALVDVVVRPFRPHVVLARSVDSSPGRGSDDVPLLRGRDTVGGVPAAYVCERFLCLAPVTEPDELERSLSLEAY
jgi:uncharacterized protein YyaL (SSP411 family)